MSNTEANHNISQRPIRVLAMDGGGVRGLSSLLLLRELMERLGFKKGIGVARPSECFDLIIGTGTGGISALFLGRLHMTVDEAVEEYLRVAETAFKPSSSLRRRLLPHRASLNGDVLERAVGEVVEKVLGDSNAYLDDGTNASTSCHTAILATTSAHADAPPYVFRSYPTGNRPASKFTIRQVARATTSAAGLFSSVSLGKPPVQFIDASIAGYNNPAEIALHEAAQIWPGLKISCFVSLGTGLQKIIQVSGKWAKLVKASEQIVQDCKRVHYALSHRRSLDGLPYFRFNVNQGLDVDVREWSQAGSEGQLTGVTEGYTRQPEIERELNKCVQILNGESASSMNVPSSQANQAAGKFLPLLNPAPHIFHGRDNYVESAVTMLLQDKAAHLAILGSGGIGKTAIARAVLHNHRIKNKFGEHRRFVSCEGITSSASLVDTLCTTFELVHLSTNRQKDLLLFLTQTYPTQPLFLILDNFETIWDVKQASSEVEELLGTLASVPMLSLMLTMRGAECPAGLKWTLPHLPVVKPLSPAAARDSYLDICGQEDEKLDVLLQAVDYVPLAVTLMAHLGQNEQPTHLLNRWEKEQTLLLSRPHNQGRLDNVEVSIQLSLESYRMQALPDALLLLSIIAILPSGVFTQDLPAITPNLPTRDLAAATLRDVGLAYYDSVQTFHVLSPIRSYIMRYHPPKSTLLYDLESYYFQLTALGKHRPGHDGFNSAVAILSPSESNVEAVLTRALLDGQANPNLVFQAALDWTRFLYYTRPRSTIIQLAVHLAKQINKEDRLAQCLQSLGDIQRTLSDYEQAQKNLSAAQAIFEALGKPLEAAQCLRSLGDIQTMLNDYDRAWELLSSARAQLVAMGEQLGAARCLQSLGNIQRRFYNYEDAQKMLIAARAEFEAIHERLGAARCLQSLGIIQKLLYNYDNAKELFSTAQAEFKAIYEPRGAAQCLWSLGNIQYLLNNYKPAQEMLLAAQAEFKAFGDQLGAAKCLEGLGNIQYMLNNYEPAKEMLLAAQAQFKARHERQRAAHCLQSLANIQRMLYNYEAAWELFSTARAEFAAIHAGQGAAQCLWSLGNIQYMLNNYQPAQEMLLAARAEFEAIGEPLGAAQCLWSLGDIYYMLDSYEHAEELLSTAQAEFEAIGNLMGIAHCLTSLGYVSQEDGRPEEAKILFAQAKEQFEQLRLHFL